MSRHTKYTKKLQQFNKRRKYTYTYNRNNFKPEPDVPHKVKTRKCLMCSISFQSNHIGERVCSECKQTSEWKQPHMGL